MPKIIHIVAIDQDNAIGYKNQLLYKLSNDLKRFKELTTGHTIIMGRKTFESLPKGALPNRRNIVLSKTIKTAYPSTELYDSIQEALANCDEDEVVFIMGGETIYRQTLELADCLEITEINSRVENADAFYPQIDKSKWKETKRIAHPIDEKHAFSFDYVTYIKA